MATQTFLCVGCFDTREEADACEKYVRSKFLRTMLGVLKSTQDNYQRTWRLIPTQDFTSNSVIDWSVSVSEIDKQLYRLYNLSDEEVNFIEKNVKPM